MEGLLPTLLFSLVLGHTGRKRYKYFSYRNNFGTVSIVPYFSRDIVSVLGPEEGYTVKYTPPPEGVPEGEARGTPEVGGVYLTVYPASSPNMDIISF